MVKLRLSRFGRKGEPTYRIVATDSNKKRDGRSIEELGYYLPQGKKIELKKERVQYWISVGAQPTDTVARMLVKEGVLGKEALPTKKYSEKPGQKSLDRVEAKAAKIEAEKLAKVEAKAAAKQAKADAKAAPAEETATVEAETETTEATEPAAEEVAETEAA